MPVAVFAVFGSASIHELTLDAVDLGYFHISSGISPVYALYLFGFLVVGYFLTPKYHKEIWALVFAFNIIYYLVGIPFVSNNGTTINADGSPGPGFYNPGSNLVEVVGWLIPSSFWLLSRKWFARPESQS